MNEFQICHWLLWKGNKECQSAFAPDAKELDGFVRIGALASSEQFVFPVVFAVPKSFKAEPAQAKDVNFKFRFSLYRDDEESAEPAFAQMEHLKVALLVSELSSAIVRWVNEIGLLFISIKTSENDGSFDLSVFGSQMTSLSLERAKVLLCCGIEMMSYSRGLKCVWLSGTKD